MTPEQEQKLLQSLYDRLFDAITYVPDGGKTNVFQKSTSFLQFSKNDVLNPDDFKNALSPLNPNGNLKAALAFSAMVDQIPNVAVNFTPSGRKVSETYKFIVDNANTDKPIDPTQQSIYDKAYKFLNQEKKIVGFAGSESVQWVPTSLVDTYDRNQSAYVKAITAYRLAQNEYDLDKIDAVLPYLLC